MILVRLIGYVLLLAGIAALGAEIYRSLEAGHWVLLPFGEIWATIDIESLNIVQAGLERHVHPLLWDPVLLSIVLAPAWLVLGLPGLILILIARQRRRRRMFS
jgi:hypothetical protein